MNVCLESNSSDYLCGLSKTKQDKSNRPPGIAIKQKLLVTHLKNLGLNNSNKESDKFLIDRTLLR